MKINVDEILKGTIIAITLMAGTALGAILRKNQVNGYAIWFIISVINIVAAVFVYKLIKIELAKKPEQAAPLPEENKNISKKKKNLASSDEKEAQSESETPKFETPADKKDE